MVSNATPSNQKVLVATLFILLCLIWGSSFMLMKIGMYRPGSQQPLLTPWQLASLRMGTASVFFLPWGLRSFKYWQRHPQRHFIWLAGIIGSFIPAILFCLAETKVTSALAGMLNATTPIFTVFIGMLVFGTKPKPMQLAGLVVGLGGCWLLFGSQIMASGSGSLYGLLILLATVCYGFNVNLARHKLSDLPAFTLTSMSMSFLLLPSLMLAALSGLFQVPALAEGMPLALSAGALLGILGTAIATVIFYALVKMAGPVLASMVTYGIPFIALGWGLVLGESVTTLQLAGLLVILAGVFLAGKK